MKFKLIFSLLATTIITTSCASSSGFDWNSLKNNDLAITYKSTKFDNYDTSFDADTYEKCCYLLVECAEKEDIANYDKYIRYVDDHTYRLYSCLDIYETRYYADKSDTESKEQYDKLYDLTRLYSEKRFASAEIIYKSGNRNFIYYFYGNMTDAQIEEYLSQNKYDEKMSAWEKTINDLQNAVSVASNDYEQGTITLEEFNNIYYDSYFNLISTGNELAKYTGYSNYLEYLYKATYGRDYSYKDSLYYSKYVKDYVLPLYNKTSNYVLDDPNFEVYLNNINLANKYFDFTTPLNGLADFMNGSYLSNYDSIWSNGYYCFSGSDNSMGTAYTVWLPYEDEYLLFFSKNYQSVLTICHEFGHVNAFMTNDNNSYYSMDIKETHSTANEYLYMVYTSNNISSMDIHYNDFICSMLNNIRNDMFSLCGPAIASEIEYLVYSDSTLTKEKMISYINDVKDDYPSINPAYIAYSTCVAPGYYISYGTSGVASLQLFIYMMDDLSDGSQKYQNLIQYKDKDTSTLSIWNSVGVNSPFDDQTYINLVNKLSSYLKMKEN